MNEVDPWLLLPLCILYEMQNQIFQQMVSDDAEKITNEPYDSNTLETKPA